MLHELPNNRLYRRALISSSQYHQSLGDLIIETRRNIARDLADKIAQEEKFIKLVPDNGQFVELFADVVVLTSEEYLGLCKQSFKEGVDYALYRRPMEFVK